MPQSKTQTNKGRGRKFAEAPLTEYERDRMRRCLSNNARLQQLGIPALVDMFQSATIFPEKNKLRNNEDSGSEYSPEEDHTSEGDLSDGNLIPEMDAPQNLESTPASQAAKQSKRKFEKTTKKSSKMPPGGIRSRTSKRVLAEAPMQDLPTDRCTRSKKNCAAKVNDAGTQSTRPLPPTEISMLATTATNASTTEEGGRNIDVHIQEVFPGQYNEVNDDTQVEATHESTMNEPTQDEQTDDGIDSDDDEEQWDRGTNMGKNLERETRSRKAKFPVVIAEGKIRPDNPVIAAKFATQCNLVVKNHVPIFPHWKDYKKKPNIFKDYLGKVGAKFNMDITSGPIRKACKIMMKEAIRQRRYRLKKKYFNPFPLHMVTKTSPVTSMTDGQWNMLVESWKEQKKMETCAKNKANRAKVQFHQTTGSRSYDIHLQTLAEKYTDEPPNAYELFKECHYSNKKKGFTPTVQSALAEMERQFNLPGEDGQEPKTTTDVVADFLAEKTKKNTFLRNVGIQKAPGRSNKRELEAELEMEKRGSNELRDVVNIQRNQIEAMEKKLEEERAARAKQDEEMRQKQAETDALIRRLMSMVSQSHPTT